MAASFLTAKIRSNQCSAADLSDVLACGYVGGSGLGLAGRMVVSGAGGMRAVLVRVGARVMLALSWCARGPLLQLRGLIQHHDHLRVAQPREDEPRKSGRRRPQSQARSASSAPMYANAVSRDLACANTPASPANSSRLRSAGHALSSTIASAATSSS
jgi:hypothetical protein